MKDKITDTEAIAFANISKGTYYAWVKKYPTVVRNLQLAVLASKQIHPDVIKASIKNKD